jgi:hypothetical protein
MSAARGPDFTQFLLKEYDYYMQRIGVCQDVAKSIVLRAVAMVLVIGVGSWTWIRSVETPSLVHGGACIGVTGCVLLAVIGYAVFSSYLTWLDRRMCELKLNQIRRWFFRGQSAAFDLARYEKLTDIRRKGAWKQFARVRRGRRFGNPWFLNTLSFVLLGVICFVVVIIFVVAEVG